MTEGSHFPEYQCLLVCHGDKWRWGERRLGVARAQVVEGAGGDCAGPCRPFFGGN